MPCENCSAYRKDNEEQGRCCYYPPKVFMGGSDRHRGLQVLSAFPVVKKGDYCLQHVFHCAGPRPEVSRELLRDPKEP